MKSDKPPRVAACASASLYAELISFSNEIDSTKIDLILPNMAVRMKYGSTDSDKTKINWAETSYEYKAELIREHFTEIEKCDAVLVTNFPKNGKEDYIGGNVLMEMTVAFYLKKPIFVLHSAPEYSPLIDEIMGMQPVFLNGDTSKITKVLHRAI